MTLNFRSSARGGGTTDLIPRRRRSQRGLGTKAALRVARASSRRMDFLSVSHGNASTIRQREGLQRECFCAHLILGAKGASIFFCEDREGTLICLVDYNIIKHTSAIIIMAQAILNFTAVPSKPKVQETRYAFREHDGKLHKEFAVSKGGGKTPLQVRRRRRWQRRVEQRNARPKQLLPMNLRSLPRLFSLL